jgi:hypothetical protein
MQVLTERSPAFDFEIDPARTYFRSAGAAEVVDPAIQKRQETIGVRR